MLSKFQKRQQTGLKCVDIETVFLINFKLESVKNGQISVAYEGEEGGKMVVIVWIGFAC